MNYFYNRHSSRFFQSAIDLKTNNQYGRETNKCCSGMFRRGKEFSTFVGAPHFPPFSFLCSQQREINEINRWMGASGSPLDSYLIISGRLTRREEGSDRQLARKMPIITIWWIRRFSNVVQCCRRFLPKGLELIFLFRFFFRVWFFFFFSFIHLSGIVIWIGLQVFLWYSKVCT